MNWERWQSKGKARDLILYGYNIFLRIKASPVGEAVNGVKPLTEEDRFYNLLSLLQKPRFKYQRFILSRLLLVSLVKSSLPEGESS